MNKIEYKNEGKNIEIKIYGEIGEGGEEFQTSLEALNKMLEENRDAALIDVYINSTGGSVFEGVAIYNMLKRNKAYKRVFIEGFACSVASVIAMAGNKIVMPKSSMMMIHNAWTVIMGNAEQLRKTADDLDKINETIINAYMKKSKMDRESIVALMDKESFLSADECLQMGFCTEISDAIDEEKVAEGVDNYSNKLQNKLDTLLHIQNAINSIDLEETDVEDAETEEVVEAQANETPIEDVEETTEEVNEAEAQDEVSQVSANALKKFFNLTEEK